MDIQGLALCTRFSYPPNSLSLCGPEKQIDLQFYASLQTSDAGTGEILSRFSTLYPYLSFIAHENNIRDPFDRNVVEAYWIGNSLLKRISPRKLALHLTNTLDLKRKIPKKNMSSLLEKIPLGAFPYHAFHVLNVYTRTGHNTSLHTVQTMDACIINWGKVIKISSSRITVSTKPLILKNDRLEFGPIRQRELTHSGENDVLAKKVSVGDCVSYHWGYFCNTLTPTQYRNLTHFTNYSLRLANARI